MKKLAPIAAMLLVACSRDIQNSDAVRQGVLEYLNARSAQTGLDMNMMQLEVTSVSFEKTQARATVFFRPKGGSAEGGMSMSYTLDRQGDKWVVRPRQEGGSPHALPPLPGSPGGAPPAGAPGSMPPGHPPVGSKQ